VNWEGVPLEIKKIIPFYQEYKEYVTQKKAALIITKGCHNWVCKPMCKDGTIGIRPRLFERTCSIRVGGEFGMVSIEYKKIIPFDQEYKEYVTQKKAANQSLSQLGMET